jgi:hypothetical protein
MRALTRAIADPYSPSSLSARMRSRRWEILAARFPHLAEMTVVDLGGDARSWSAAPLTPQRLVLVNTFPQEAPEPWMETVMGDACDPPAHLRRQRFDFVYSNSVLEHVGGYERRQQFTQVARALGDHLWLQTPYRYFPLEPHWLFPFFQFLPLRLRAEVTVRWPLGNYDHLRDLGQAVQWASRVELLSATELAFHLPEAEIVRERVGGLTKSLIAVV